MFEQISNQTVSTTTRVTSVEKVKPSKHDHDFFENMKQKKDESQHEISKKKIEEVVKGMNDFIQPINTSIKFVLHDKLKDYYVEVVDDQTNEVIKEIPSKKLLDTYANMMEFVGLLVDKKI